MKWRNHGNQNMNLEGTQTLNLLKVNACIASELDLILKTCADGPALNSNS